MSSRAPPYPETPAGPSSTKVEAKLLRKEGHSRPLLIALHGQDSIAYAACLVDGGGSAMGVFAPEQRFSTSNQPHLNNPWTDPTSFAKGLAFKLKTPLPTSLEYARQVAELSHLPNQPLPCQHRCGASSTSVEPVKSAPDQVQVDLATLARWLRHRNPALPPPIVGGLESDPSDIADRYGVKGMSVLTAFINMDGLSCRVCAFTAMTVPLALLHQQQARHFQV